MRKFLALVITLLFALSAAAPSFAATKTPAKKSAKGAVPAGRQGSASGGKIAVKKKAKKRRVRRVYYPLGSRPKFPTDHGPVKLEPVEPVSQEIVAPPPPPAPVSAKGSWFAEGGLGGGALAVEGGYKYKYSDKINLCAAGGYAIGNKFSIVVLDLAQVRYELAPAYFVGGGLTYAMYSALVSGVTGLSGTIPNQNMFGVELLGGYKRDRLTIRAGYNTALGLRLSAGYDF